MSQGLHLCATSNQEGAPCPFCQKPIARDEAITLCADCRQPYHRECWDRIDGECRHPARPVAGVDAEPSYSKQEKPGGGEASAGGVVGHLVTLYREQSVMLWAALGCAALGFYFMSASAFGEGAGYLFATGAALAGLSLGAVRWLDYALSNEGGALDNTEKKLLTAAMAANTSLFLTGAFVFFLQRI